jgi:hypothetical protein
VLGRPPEPAGEVDDAPAGVAQRHEGGRHARDLVVGVRREMQSGPCHGYLYPGHERQTRERDREAHERLTHLPMPTLTDT